jgi:hypothetical protein
LKQKKLVHGYQFICAQSLVLAVLAQNPQWLMLVVAQGALVVKNWMQEAIKFATAIAKQLFLFSM